jgi:hypothetical protein
MLTDVDQVARAVVTGAKNRVIVITDCDKPAVAGIGSLMLSECRVPGSLFTELVSSAAHKAGVDPRALRVRALLHLPRIATSSGQVSIRQIERELFHSARLLRNEATAVGQLMPDRELALEELNFVKDFDTAIADKLFSSLHYLRSARPGSRNFALVNRMDGRPVTICSTSPLEWKKVGKWFHTQFGISHEAIWDVSRVYSCDAAPRNAISFLLSKVRNSLRHGGKSINLLITAVDPNLGFTGSSYRAAGWQCWLTVHPRPYLYQDRRYASPRQLQQRFGTSSLTELKAQYPNHRIEYSRSRLLDSMIFCCRINGDTETMPLGLQHRLHR